MNVHIGKEMGGPCDVDVEIIKMGCKLPMTGRYIDEDNPSFHRRTIMHTWIVSLHCSMVSMFPR